MFRKKKGGNEKLKVSGVDYEMVPARRAVENGKRRRVRSKRGVPSSSGLESWERLG